MGNYLPVLFENASCVLSVSKRDKHANDTQLAQCINGERAPMMEGGSGDQAQDGTLNWSTK